MKNNPDVKPLTLTRVMLRAEELLILLEDDESLDDKSTRSLNTLLQMARSNSSVARLSIILKNTDSSTEMIIDRLESLIDRGDNDFRVFCLLIALYDSRHIDDVVSLSIRIKEMELPSSKILAFNLLLKESMYGGKEV